MKNVNLLTHRDIYTASLIPDLDRALKSLMDKAGIKHGDLAGHYFCPDEWEVNGCSKRLESLHLWLIAESEISY